MGRFVRDFSDLFEKPYGSWAAAYERAWGHYPLWTPPKAKHPVPTGFTGYAGRWPEAGDYWAWQKKHGGRCNIALRMPLDVIGLDVDQYGEKHGWHNLLKLLTELGVELPLTWRSTSRTDGVSGIYFFRVPEGLKWPTQATKDVEIVRFAHRYAMVYPSIHDKTGATYYWYDPAGAKSIFIPLPEDLPDLPAELIAQLTNGVYDTETGERADYTAEDRDRLLTGGSPCPAVAAAAARYEERSEDSAHHDAMLSTLRAVTRLGEQGHAGVAEAVAELAEAFYEDLDGVRDGAGPEFARMLDGGIAKALVDPTRESDKGCCGDNSRRAKDREAKKKEKVVHSSWKAVDLKPVLQGQELDPPPSILRKHNGEGLFYAGKVHSLHGESESLKTWLALVAVMEQADVQRYVLYIDFEDRASTLVGRLRALGMADEDIEEYVIYVRPDVPVGEEELADLLAQVAEFGVVLAVLDGVTEAMNLHGLDSDRGNQSVAQWLALLPRPLADAGSAVVQIDHVIKSKEDRAKRNDAIGGQHKRAGLDGAGYMVENVVPFGRGREGRSFIYISKDRPGHVQSGGDRRWTATFNIRANEDGTDISFDLYHHDESKEKAPKNEAEVSSEILLAISKYIAKHPGSSKRVVEGAVTGKSITIRRALDILIRDEYVAESKNPRGSGMVLHNLKQWGID